MAKQLVDARTILRGFLDEVSPLDWTNTELNTLLNIYYHSVTAFVMTSYEDYYMTTKNFNTVANQEEYGSSDGAPTDLFKVRRVELNFDVTASSGAPTRCLPIYNFDAVRRDLGYANAGIGLKVFGNAFYYTYGFGSNFKIGFIPMPQNPGGSGTNAIKMWYVQEQADLVNDTDIFNIPFADKNFRYIVYGAAADALRFGQQAVKEAQDFEDKYDRGVELMQAELHDRTAEEGKTTLDTGGDLIDFNSPY